MVVRDPKFQEFWNCAKSTWRLEVDTAILSLVDVINPDGSGLRRAQSSCSCLAALTACEIEALSRSAFGIFGIFHRRLIHMRLRRDSFASGRWNEHHPWIHKSNQVFR